MKTLNRFIIEKLKLGKDTKIIKYNYFPKDFNELKDLIEQLLEERGEDADLNDIDVSEITTFYNHIRKQGLFQGLDPHNIDISQWDVSNVKNMREMFRECKNLNCDLSKWNISNVKFMQSMFEGCISFTGQGLENWKVSSVTDIRWIFLDCKSLKNKPSWYKK